MTLCSHTIVRDGEDFIEPCLRQILPYVNRALVLIDSRSSDGTVEIINKLKKEYDNLEVDYFVVKEPMDLVKARNRQIEKTTEDWFWIVDDDEYWIKEDIEKVIKYLEGDYVAFGVKYIFLVSKTQWALQKSKGYMERIFRNLPSMNWRGTHKFGGFPGERVHYKGKHLKIKENSEIRSLTDVSYIHLSYLKRKGWRESCSSRQRGSIATSWKYPLFDEELHQISDLPLKVSEEIKSIMPISHKELKMTFLGKRIAQTPRAIALWERILTDTDFKRVIEIGTLRGNLSLFFLLFCLNKDAEFYTYDIRIKWKEGKVKELLNFEKYYRNKDVFQNIDEIKDLIQKEGITVLFCDGGNKAKEFQTFGSFMKQGDIIAVHDWTVEITEYHVRSTCKKHNLKEVFIKESEYEGLTRVFQKI